MNTDNFHIYNFIAIVLSLGNRILEMAFDIYFFSIFPMCFPFIHIQYVSHFISYFMKRTNYLLCISFIFLHILNFDCSVSVLHIIIIKSNVKFSTYFITTSIYYMERCVLRIYCIRLYRENTEIYSQLSTTHYSFDICVICFMHIILYS